MIGLAEAALVKEAERRHKRMRYASGRRRIETRQSPAKSRRDEPVEPPLCCPFLRRPQMSRRDASRRSRSLRLFTAKCALKRHFRWHSRRKHGCVFNVVDAACRALLRLRRRHRCADDPRRRHDRANSTATRCCIIPRDREAEDEGGAAPEEHALHRRSQLRPCSTCRASQAAFLAAPALGRRADTTCSAHGLRRAASLHRCSPTSTCRT